MLATPIDPINKIQEPLSRIGQIDGIDLPGISRPSNRFFLVVHGLHGRSMLNYDY